MNYSCGNDSQDENDQVTGFPLIVSLTEMNPTTNDEKQK